MALEVNQLNKHHRQTNYITITTTEDNIKTSYLTKCTHTKGQSAGIIQMHFWISTTQAYTNTSTVSNISRKDGIFCYQDH